MADEVFDVVVVGGGGSGLAAAIEAAEAGASVAVLEKAPELRGSTGRSIGSITAACTSDQKRLGIVDSPREHAEDMGKFAKPFSDLDNAELALLMAGKMADTVAWLRRQGIEFFGPFEEPPHRKPRMHMVLPNSAAYPFHLSRRAKALGVSIRLSARAARLVLEQGRVAGVSVEQDGAAWRALARRAVILAGGDFSGDPDFKREFCPEAYAAIPPVNPWSTGDCHRMAIEAGGVVLKGDYLTRLQLRFAPPPGNDLLMRIPPYTWLARLMRLGLRRLPQSWMRPFILRFVTTVLAPERALFEDGAVLVNKQGQLIRRPGEEVGLAIAKHAPEGAFFVFDAALFEKYSSWPHFVSTAPGVAYAYMPDYCRNRPDLYARAETLPELAQKLGMPAGAPREAIDEYRRLAGSTQAPSGAAPLKPPFSALGPLNAFVILTNSGLKVSTGMEALRADGSPIPGLYAAGSAGQGGLFLAGHGHHLGWAFTSGRIAGRGAAAHPRAGAGPAQASSMTHDGEEEKNAAQG